MTRIAMLLLAAGLLVSAAPIPAAAEATRQLYALSAHLATELAARIIGRELDAKDHERLIEAELPLDRVDRGRGRVAPHVLNRELIGVLPGQAWDKEEDRERDHADHEQQEDRNDQPPDNERDHRS